MTEQETKPVLKTQRMRITQLMERKRGVPSQPTGSGRLGGHRYWCSKCGGFRTFHASLQPDGRLILKCSSCERESTLKWQGGVWVPAHMAETLRAYIPVRAEQIILDYLSKREAPAPTPKPGAVARTRGSVAKLLPALERLTHREVDEALEESETEPEEAETTERESGGVRSGGNRAGTDPNEETRVTPQNSGPDATRSVASEEGQESPRRASSRTKAKAAVGLVSAPFLLMGALYVLAWRGTYIWPIYYAIQPLWRSWMNDWPFVSLSVVVPAVCLTIYAIRFWTSHKNDEVSEDILDWRPCSETGEEYDRPQWMDEG